MSKRYEQYTTDEFLAVYPSLDQGKPNEAFNQNCYEVSRRLDPTSEEYKDIVDFLHSYDADMFEEITGKPMPAPENLKLPIKDETEKGADDTRIPTGKVLLRFKCPDTITKRKTGEKIPNHVPIFDTAGNRMLKPGIWGGSKIKVAYQITPYSTGFGAGLSLRLRQVQVIDLVTNSDESPFEFKGGGYVQEQAADPVPVDAPDEPVQENKGEDIPF